MGPEDAQETSCLLAACSIGGVACTEAPDPATGVYGLCDVYTDTEGKLYFWLPETQQGTPVPVRATAQGHSYQAPRVTVEAGGTGTARLLPQSLTALATSEGSFAGTGGAATITATGNFTGPLLLAVFDENGTRIGESWATAQPQDGAEEQQASLLFPGNTTGANTVYTVRASTDGGATWENAETVITVLRAPIFADAGHNTFSVEGALPKRRVAFGIAAAGHRQDAADAIEGDERYIPTTADANPTVAFDENDGAYTAVMSIETPGGYTLTVHYQLQQWNGTAWQDVPDETDTKTATLTVRAGETGSTSTASDAPTSGSTPSSSSPSTSGGGSSTGGGTAGGNAPAIGDTGTPLLWAALMLFALLGAGCALSLPVHRRRKSAGGQNQ